jgi:glutaredoxin
MRRENEMKLKLFTLPNCPKCPLAKQVAETVARQRKDVTLEVIDLSDSDNMISALMMQIASTPSFAIEGVPVFLDHIPSIDELNARIDEYKRVEA